MPVKQWRRLPEDGVYPTRDRRDQRVKGIPFMLRADLERSMSEEGHRNRSDLRLPRSPRGRVREV